MNIRIGQGIFGAAPYPDGEFPKYKRPYLVVGISENYIEVLTVSSTAGKEHKLLFSTNIRLKNFKPPFLYDSFVKLDSLTKIKISDAKQFTVLHNGECLQREELENIIKNIIR